MEKTTPLKAIKEKCLNCCCYQANEVRLCPMTNCALYPFRTGKNTNIKLSLSKEAIELRTANLGDYAKKHGNRQKQQSGEGNHEQHEWNELHANSLEESNK